MSPNDTWGRKGQVLHDILKALLNKITIKSLEKYHVTWGWGWVNCKMGGGLKSAK